MEVGDFVLDRREPLYFVLFHKMWNCEPVQVPTRVTGFFPALGQTWSIQSGVFVQVKIRVWVCRVVFKTGQIGGL